MNKADKEVQQTQLNDEKKTMKLLELVYKQARKDCEKKIRELSTRTDLENTQSVIYQKKYQQVLIDQIDAALYDLQDGQFTTISDYLEESYKNGYVGTFYSMKVDAGIPLVLPIRQDQVVKAIKTNSKLSKNLYDRLGEDVNYLKRSIRAELSRGITNGSTWNQMATKIAVGMNSPFNRAHSNAVRIARTEGHRIQNEATLDGMYGAKKKGADVVKQWDATLDGRTRDEHRIIDGQIRELDEPFDVGGEKMDAPGVGGSARNVCNCRCCLLQRAKWALDDDELDTLKERAEFFGLDKAKDFEEFKEKYLEAAEHEQSKTKYKYQSTIINKDVIKSPKYRRRFNNVSDDDRVNRAAWQSAKEMLEHRSGTRYEDIAFIDYSTGKTKINKGYHKENTAKPNKPMMEMLENSSPNTIIAIHNHPGSSVPSLADLVVCANRGYMFGLVACHDGKIYKYSVDKDQFNHVNARFALDRMETQGYDEDIEKMLKQAGVHLEVL